MLKKIYIYTLIPLIVFLVLVLIAFKTNWIYKQCFRIFINRMKNGTITILSRDGAIEYLSIKKTDAPYGPNNHGEFRVDDYGEFCKAIVLNGDIGLGELYMDGKWESPNMLNLFLTILSNDKYLRSSKFATNTLSDKQNIKTHYDISNELYGSFLTDDFKAYSCGFFFKPDDTLNDAQYNKVNEVIRKLDVRKGGERILDVGCGWGNIMKYVASKTGASVDGVTLSDEQAKYIHDNIPLSQVYNMHYENLPIELNNAYDKIYSIGIMEHIRFENYDKFFAKLNSLLKDSGRIVLHMITYSANIHLPANSTKQTRNFINKYIFPGGQIPKREWIVDAAVRSNLKLVHMEVYGGQHYARTLEAWRAQLDFEKFDQKLMRMFELYFFICEAAFFQDRLNITHFIFDKIDSLQDANSEFHTH